MTQTRDYNDCIYFGRRKCLHREDEIMKKATQDIPEIKGPGSYQTTEFPTDEEINKICETANHTPWKVDHTCGE